MSKLYSRSTESKSQLRISGTGIGKTLSGASNVQLGLTTNVFKSPEILLKKNEDSGDFPGGAVDKTPRSQCRGPGFDPWSGK